ncbi:hypothetical protein DOM22_17290 [Bdellovibrio sp. ZAP7]|uniref:hypothetical protein n=1 Tax=Bdellovibrio sp. ZAP7 TaxID=2231053 RepID=UPI00115A7677|nr:hypothetical protein [Bdellovibrio sp. ZAP7]QDK46784.1 hypothetical protein DOM22_17290 [Bdellovibrio sp. ZAP7]
MRILKVLLATLILSVSSIAFAAPSTSRSDTLMSDDGSAEQSLTTTRRPSSLFKQPGILPCPDQSRMTKMNDLARLENHSRDCQPSTDGALRVQPDRPDGEVQGSEVPAQFE